jgi:hypothetical protein
MVPHLWLGTRSQKDLTGVIFLQVIPNDKPVTFFQNLISPLG